MNKSKIFIQRKNYKDETNFMNMRRNEKQITPLECVQFRMTFTYKKKGVVT